MNKIKRVFALIKKKGVNYFLTEVSNRVSDHYNEMRLNIDTKGYVLKQDLKISHPDYVDYGAVNYRYMKRALSFLKVDIATSTLLDFGCGKGRVVAYAASCNFKKIIGVENTMLIEIAERNIKNMKRRQTASILLKKCDAENFTVPSFVNVIYFYNPFTGLTLEKTLYNIFLSFKESPRKIYIIFFNNAEFEKIIINHEYVTKIHQSQPHPEISCGIYEINILHSAL